MNAVAYTGQFESQTEVSSPRLWLVHENWAPECGTVVSLMSRDILRVSPNDNLSWIAEQMTIQDHDHCLVVHESGELLGLVTLEQLVPLTRAEGQEKRVVSDVMVVAPKSLDEKTTLDEALQVLRTRRFLVLPVVDQKGRAVGSLSPRDLLRVVSSRIESALSE